MPTVSWPSVNTRSDVASPAKAPASGSKPRSFRRSNSSGLGEGSATSPAKRSFRGVRRSSVVALDQKRLSQLQHFSSATAMKEISSREGAYDEPAAWSHRAALLFVDISGFTNLCTRVTIDRLQYHINEYFGKIINIVSAGGGDVLRFAGDALLCAWPLRPDIADGELALALAAHAACATALRLN